LIQEDRIMKKIFSSTSAFALLLSVSVLIFLLGGCGSVPSETASAPPTENAGEASVAPTGAVETPEDVFVFSRDNFPRMDGSTSMIPLGQAIASVLLGESRDKVASLAAFNKTSQSYRNLMNGDADIVIAAEPSAAVFDEMKQADFQYDMTPIATDALVFLVNASNPVKDLTTEQIQKIYTGEIKNWKEVGGPDLAIEAFQRNAESGSQTLMEKLVMPGLTMAEAPEGYMIGEMEGLITAVRSFDGTASAIGYTVYYYADDMKMADGLRILSVDGVTPSDETISTKAYPFLNPYYAAIATDDTDDSPAHVLYNWLLSPEGKNLIRTEGYVPVAD
jgi:phosphate transport system substrate-binding protein